MLSFFFLLCPGDPRSTSRSTFAAERECVTRPARVVCFFSERPSLYPPPSPLFPSPYPPPLTPRSGDKSNSPSIVLRQSNLRKSYKDGGDKSHKRRCHSFPVQSWPLSMPVSRNRLRSEKNAHCPPCSIPESSVESLRLSDQSHKKPCYFLRASLTLTFSKQSRLNFMYADSVGHVR